MAKENIDVLPVVSKENTKIIGILSFVILRHFEGLLELVSKLYSAIILT